MQTAQSEIYKMDEITASYYISFSALMDISKICIKLVKYL